MEAVACLAAGLALINDKGLSRNNQVLSRHVYRGIIKVSLKTCTGFHNQGLSRNVYRGTLLVRKRAHP